MSSVAKERSPDTRYTADTIDMMDKVTAGLYDIWLDLAVEHALKEGRMKVTVPDAKNTLQGAVEKILEGPHGKTTTAERTS